MFTEDDKRAERLYLTLAVLALLAGLVAGAVLLSACGGSQQRPLPIPSPIATWFTPRPKPTGTPTPLVPGPSSTSTRIGTTSPVPSSTATATRTAPKPSFTPTPGAAATPFQTTGGKAIVDLDLGSFRVQPPGPNGDQLDYYAAATLLWEPASGNVKPDTPALELSIRGTSDEHCLTAPCTNTALGLVARWSCNIRHDAGEPDEHKHVGEGINYRNRIPIGPGPITTVYVEWGPDGRRVTVSTNYGSWTAKRGVKSPGFGVFVAGIANAPKGIGWAREPWSIQRNGGAARLVSWKARDPLGILSTCP